MKILIIETEIDGHYISLYLKNIVREILSRKIESLTIITKKSAIADENYKFFKNKKINIFYIRDIKKPKKYNFLFLLIYQIRYYFNIKKSFNTISKNKKFDLVYVNTLDHFDKALSIFGSPFKKVNFYGLFNHIRFHLSYFKLEKNFLFSYFYEILFRRILKIKYFNSNWNTG